MTVVRPRLCGMSTPLLRFEDITRALTTPVYPPPVRCIPASVFSSECFLPSTCMQVIFRFDEPLALEKCKSKAGRDKRASEGKQVDNDFGVPLIFKIAVASSGFVCVEISETVLTLILGGNSGRTYPRDAVAKVDEDKEEVIFSCSALGGLIIVVGGLKTLAPLLDGGEPSSATAASTKTFCL